MSTGMTTAKLLERNKTVAESHEPILNFSEYKSHGLDLPRILVLTCADPRCHPEYYLNVKPTDGVIVVRNVCGHATYGINDILSLDRLIGLHEILVVHHSDCGSMMFTDDQVRQTLRERAGDDKALDSMYFGGIKDLEQSVKDDVAIIKSSKFMRKELSNQVHGFIYDLKTGKLNPVQI